MPVDLQLIKDAALMQLLRLLHREPSDTEEKTIVIFVYNECFFIAFDRHSMHTVWYFGVVDNILGFNESVCQTKCELSWWICICCVWVSSASRSSHLFTLSVLITYAEEGGYVFGAVCLSVCRSVCLSVRRITRKLVNGF